MAKGVFRGATGLNQDRRTKFGKMTSGGGLNALGSAGKGTASKKRKAR